MNILTTKEYLTPKEAAKLLKVSKQSIMKMIHTKRIKAVKFGSRTYRIPIDEIKTPEKEYYI
jgi:excisionase family DNA binding protein|tara:strand:- start:502 stop:687 length:186 start_codon:yes stop_codon:yes gene_type:complete